jgi:hypothetical protein
VRHQLEASNMPVDETPDDDSCRHTYNFAPGNHGLVYRADGPEYGNKGREEMKDEQNEPAQGQTNDPTLATSPDEQVTKYKLQAMKWGGCVL